LGPGIACADINGDGRDDFYVGGAAGQAGQLLVSDPSGGYRLAESDDLALDRACEDMGAIFFDADQDGDHDLYVVSGSSEWEPAAAQLQDRFYRNDAGVFRRDVKALPAMRASGSVVSAADYDRDGDLDLFVGGRVVPGQYPLADNSYLLRNDSGHFADASDELPDGARSAGMVTAACWSDADDDGWIDLWVTCEWGPIRLFRNDAGKLTEATHAAGLDTLLGWWNGIRPGDVDHDGDLDYVVTNFGLNTKYHASDEHPARIYYGDFDNSGKPQIVESEFEGDKLFPVRGKSCSTNAMPILAERFATFRQFGMAELPQIYTAEKLEQARVFNATVLASGTLINQGSDGFRFVPLPRIAQIAPAFGLELTDVNADGHCDLYLVQNFYSPQPETGRMDGGVSLLLLGDGQGNWQPVWPDESGLVVGGDAKSLVATDLNQDGRTDFVVGVNDAELLAFEMSADVPQTGRRLLVDLQPSQAYRHVVGSRVTLRSGAAVQVQELSAGTGYLSQSTLRPQFAVPAQATRVQFEVRWPDGAITQHDVEMDLTQPVQRIQFAR
jgi:hypothetical protein